jgi:hypothetical protein
VAVTAELRLGMWFLCHTHFSHVVVAVTATWAATLMACQRLGRDTEESSRSGRRQGTGFPTVCMYMTSPQVWRLTGQEACQWLMWQT